MRRAGEKMAIGGLPLKILKKLKGLTLLTPFKSIVLASAIGRGPMLDSKYLCKSLVGVLFGSIASIRYFYKKTNSIQIYVIILILNNYVRELNIY